MLRKLKRAVPAVISAVLCAAMLLGATVSAEKINKVGADVWKDAKAIANVKYYSKYIKLAANYSGKDSKNTVTYGKSRMKKFNDKLVKAAGAKKPEFSVSITDKSSVIYFAVKDSSCKAVIYMYGEDGIAYYTDGKKATYLSLSDKTKTTTSEKELTSEDISELFEDGFRFGISEDEKGRLFKIKSDGKTYYYEEFGSGRYVVGMLFSEKGSPLATVEDDEVYCISFKTKVDDSEFNIPKGYKTVDYKDFKY